MDLSRRAHSGGRTGDRLALVHAIESIDTNVARNVQENINFVNDIARTFTPLAEFNGEYGTDLSNMDLRSGDAIEMVRGLRTLEGVHDALRMIEGQLRGQPRGQESSDRSARFAGW